MLIALGIILVAIAIVFLVYIFKNPAETEKDKNNQKAIGFIGSISLMLLGILLIFKNKK